jgi:PAS domain S-box-containing protein
MVTAPTDSTVTDAPRGRHRKSLRTYVAALVALFVAAAAVNLIYQRHAAGKDGRRTALDDARFGAVIAAKALATDVGLIQTTVASTAANPSLAQVFAGVPGCRLQFAGSDALTDGHLDIVSSAGDVVCTSRSSAPGHDYRNASWRAQALTAPRLLAPVVDDRTGRQSIVVTAPVSGQGFIAAFVDLASAGPALSASFGGPRHLEFVLTTPKRRVLTRSIEPSRWVGAQLRDQAFVTDDASEDRPDLDGTRRFYGTATVEHVGWRVSAGADRAAALSSANRVAERQLFITLGGLLVFLLAIAVVHRRITRPITRLSTAVRAASVGDGAAHIAVSGPKEVEALAADVNQLMAAAERELTTSARLAAIVESSPDAIFATTREGVVTTWNPGAEAIYGYAAGDAIGRPLSSMVAPDDVTELTDMLGRVGNDTSFEHVELTCVRDDGVHIDVSISLGPVHAPDGATVGAAAIVRDVTERKRAEGERQELEHRLQQSQRLDSLGKLAGGVAHDFNNLLGAILNYAEFVREGLRELDASDGERTRVLQQDLEQIVKAGERATSLTRQLLTFGRRDSLRARVLDINGVVAEVESLLHRTLGEHVSVRTELRSPLPNVSADPSQLEQILVNLAVNARDAMPNGGNLVIETNDVFVDDDYIVARPGVQPGHYVRITVSDTGTGMTREVRERAFEPFFTTKEAGAGTGLGLATAFGVITQAGGSIEIYSEPGSGTSVRMLLPAVEATADLTRTAPDRRVEGGTETVLVAEDEDAIRELARRLLERNGYNVLTASDGREALSVAERYDGTIDLLLSDVVMPQMTGSELAVHIRASRPNTRVLFMSGYSHTILGDRHNGADNILEKPFSEQELTRRLRAVLDEHALPQDA